MELLQRPGNAACADCAAPGKGRGGGGGAGGGCTCTCPHRMARNGTEWHRTAPHRTAAAGRGALPSPGAAGVAPRRGCARAPSPPRGDAAGMLRGWWKDALRCRGPRGPAPAEVFPNFPRAGPVPRPAVSADVIPAGPRGLQRCRGRSPGGAGSAGVPWAAGAACPPCPLGCSCPVSQQTHGDNRRQRCGHPARQPLPSCHRWVPELRRERGWNVCRSLRVRRGENLGWECLLHPLDGEFLRSGRGAVAEQSLPSVVGCVFENNLRKIAGQVTFLFLKRKKKITIQKNLNLY